MHIINYDNPPPIDELRMSKLTVGKENGRWTWEKKYSVVAVWLATYSVRDTAKQCGVSAMTITGWKTMPWWSKLVQDIKATEHGVLNNKLSKLIKKSLEVIEDRLENGEVKTTKDGTEYREPVPLKEATRVASELIQRQAQVNRKVEEETIRKETMQETLSVLATEFAKWTKGDKSKPDLPFVEEVEDIDALHEERET